MNTATLEEKIASDMAKQIASEIDFEILCGFLVELGWKKIVLRPMTHEHGQEIDNWTACNVKGHFQTMGLVWIFEREQDANWFSLTWL
jgi:hypothetical protein